jgi:hypothetical protein
MYLYRCLLILIVLLRQIPDIISNQLLMFSPIKIPSVQEYIKFTIFSLVVYLKQTNIFSWYYTVQAYPNSRTFCRSDLHCKDQVLK